MFKRESFSRTSLAVPLLAVLLLAAPAASRAQDLPGVSVPDGTPAPVVSKHASTSVSPDLPAQARLPNGEIRKILGALDDKHVWVDGRGLVGWLAVYELHGMRLDASGAVVRHDGATGFVARCGQLSLRKGDFGVPGNGFLCGFPSDARFAALERVQDPKDKRANRFWLRVRVESGRVSLPRRMAEANAAGTPPPPPGKNPADNDSGTAGREPLHEALDASSERARHALRETIPDERGMDDAAITALLAGLDLDSDDPEQIAKALAEEEGLAAESGDGDLLRVVDVVTPAVPVEPGARVELSVEVANGANAGNPARFDLAVSDQHGDGTPLARCRGLELSPGQTKRFPVTVVAPRDFHLAGWAYLDPVRFRGGDLPSLPFKVKVLWDGATMSDAEILADLAERIPDKRFEIFEEHRAAWVARFRESPAEARGAIVREALGFVRDLERQETEGWWNDPARVASRAADAAAEAESAKLREFLALEAYARKQAPLQGIDLPGMLEDMVYVDDKARVHGDLGAARARLDEEIRRKNAATVHGATAVERLLLGNAGATSEFHRRSETTLAGATAAAGALNPGGATVDAAGKKILGELMEEYRGLLDAHRAAGTRPEVFAKDLESVRAKVELLKRQANLAAPGRGRKMLERVVASAEGDLAHLDAVRRKGTEFAGRADALLAKRRGYKIAGDTVAALGDAWSLYDGCERMNARIAAGEDATAALSQETLKFGVKKMMTNNPVVGAADAIMGGIGHLAYACRKDKFDAEGFDPRQYNASALADLGVDGSVAHLADMSAILGKRSGKAEPLDDAERARLGKRLSAFEAELAKTTDPDLKARLLAARTNVRERLEGR